MEIVINNCFGGFGLSGEAEALYAKKSGFELFRYKQTNYKSQDGEDLYEKIDINDDSMFSRTYTKDHGDKFSKGYHKDSGYWSTCDMKRDDPILIEVVKELAKKANGRCASLKVVEIPDGVNWEIKEYDGNEHVSESHSTWS